MSDQRFIIEMGMSNDLHGQDYTKAAARAIEDAFRHSSLPLFGATGVAHKDMRVTVTIGVQEPQEVDCDALIPLLPRGRAEVQAVFGGLNTTNLQTGDVTVVATAAIEAFLPYQGNRWRKA